MLGQFIDTQIFRRRSTGPVVASFVVALSSSSPAHASPPPTPEEATTSPDAASADAAARARARYDEGARAFGEGRFVEAALGFESAAAEKTNAVALFTAALSWEHANAPDRAADAYARSLDVTELPADSARTAMARLKTLESLLGTIHITAPPGFRVLLDANTETSTPGALHGADGVHTLTVRPPNAAIVRISVVLKSGTVTPLQLPLAERPTAEHDDRRADGLGTGRILAIATAGVGVVGLGIGTAFGVIALSRKSDAQNICPQNPCANPAGADKWNEAGSAGDISTAGFIAGGIATSLAAVLWFAWPNAAAAAPQVSVGLGRFEVKGTF